MIRKAAAILLSIMTLGVVVVACSHHTYRGCPVAESQIMTIAFVEKGGGGGAPLYSGARSSPPARASTPSPKPPSARAGTPPPANPGARAGTKANPPVVNGARPNIPAGAPAGRVPSYSGSSSIGRTYSHGGTVYVYHSGSYWYSHPLDPWNPYDPRNATNIFSPFYGEHLMAAC